MNGIMLCWVVLATICTNMKVEGATLQRGRGRAQTTDAPTTVAPTTVAPTTAKNETKAQCVPVKGHEKINVYAGMAGYDPIIGNPFDTIVDPGVKARIFIHDCEGGYYDFISYAGEDLNCNSAFSMKRTTSMEEYENARTQSVEEEMSGSVSAGGSYYGISASASASYSQATNADERESSKVFQELGGEIIIAEATCITESVSIADAVRPVFTPDFINHLKRLHTASTSGDEIQKEKAVAEFIREFGTHFMRTTKLGASIAFERRFVTKGDTIEKQGSRAKCVKKEASASLSVGAVIGPSVNVEGNYLSGECKSINEQSVIGTTEGMESTKIISRGSRPKALQTWVDEKFVPVPIKRYLAKMTLLFKDDWLSKSKFYGFDYNLSGANIRMVFNSFVTKYCSIMLNGVLNDDCSVTACDDYDCKNGGTCEIHTGGVKCNCKHFFTGEHCEIDPCAGKTCGGQGVCSLDASDTTDGYICTCNSFYMGNDCETDPCVGKTCGGQGVCSLDASDTTDGYICTCNSLYRGNDCEIGANAFGCFGKVALKSHHGKYVQAKADGTANANIATRGSWETFTVEDMGPNKVALKSSHGKYLHANGYSSWSLTYKISANTNTRGTWEAFTVEKQSGGTCPHCQIALKTVHGRYITAESDGGLNGDATVATWWERFTPECVDE